MNRSLMALQKSRCILARIFAGEHEHHVAHRRQERIVVDSGVMSRGKMTLLTYETDDIAT
jgi:hypothetical protein